MRRYETVFIANPSLSQEERQPLFDKLTQLISDGQGLLVKFDEWGVKSLAYEVKKHTRGYYVLTDFCGDGPLVKELERNMGLDDRFLKYMTVCTAKEVDDEQIQTEIMEARAKPEPDVVEEAEQSWGEERPATEASEPTPEETQVATEASEPTPEETQVATEAFEPTPEETQVEDSLSESTDEEEPSDGQV
jgi:small subunit ribosomal protein S6